MARKRSSGKRTTTTKAAKEKPRQTSDVAARWTPKLVERGWTPISTFFLEHYSRLKPEITSAEAMFVIHLIRHKWTSDPPYPAFKTIAKRMGVSTSAARGYARSLERKHYLKRFFKQAETNRFILTPLFDALEEHMQSLQAAENPD